MNQDRPAGLPTFLTTREVADLLRVKERKVYDLAAAGEIPHRRITGKLLFPSAEIASWIEGETNASARERPAVLTGSHDPLLDWAIRESGCGLAMLVDGSRQGLERFAAGEAAVCGLHIPDSDGGWNIGSVSGAALRDCVLIGWVTRTRGLLLGPQAEGRVRQIGDLAGLRIVQRQPGAGARSLFDLLIDESGCLRESLSFVAGLARTESDAAAMVAAGEADVAIGIEAMARRFHLGFVPLLAERFDLLVDRRAYFTGPVRSLFEFARSEAFAQRAGMLGGYDLADLGTPRWLSP